ncbi:PREDICTED: uncharacterized protein LOC100635341 isoform X2 [Amphimedon queenslandica]|uniref:Uncharacterized protein n=1 Tax=Amphimedon queenslandica TaxID=400682 RepID=A0A1X7VRN5_AMPQE|nr:PREDICTED: uncharacterized protein LOC100635341 isoform X2 [Amphimedon queenslandica]|eukprot:XP_019856124.1 PREDICTED: uncharacterized protein LOC100635341 isoform X2 [Amphimedon queenslandica]
MADPLVVSQPEEESIQKHESDPTYSEPIDESRNHDPGNTQLATGRQPQQPEISEPPSERASAREPSLCSPGHHNNNSPANENPNSTKKSCIEKVKSLTVTIIIIATGIVSLIVAVVVICLFTTVLKPQLYNFNATIGDVSESESTFLLQINSTISSATVTAINPDLELKADIYQSTSKPPEYIEVLDTVTIHELSEKNRFRYNYFTNPDNPVYLTPGSSLLYDVSISSNSGSTCPARLYLFNNQTTYFLFISDRNSKIDSTDRSPCLFPDNGAWSFNITDSSAYYVAIAIDTGVSVLGNVTVERIQYNTTGLQLDTQLTSGNPSHTITTCDTGSGFLCTGIDDTYLILLINEGSLINFQLKTFFVYNRQKVALSCFSLILLLVFVVVFTLFLIAIIIKAVGIYKKHNTTIDDAHISLISPAQQTNTETSGEQVIGE